MSRVILVVLVVLGAGALRPAPARAAGPVTVVVDQASPAASDANPGTDALPVRTVGAGARLAEAANRAGAPVTVRVRPGVYREAVVLERRGGATDAPVTFEGAGDGVVVAGSDVWTGWAPTGDGTVVAHAWPHDWGLQPIPASWTEMWRERGISPLLQRREMVVVDGGLLRQVLTVGELRATPGSFHVDEAADVVLAHPPAGVDLAAATVEVAVRPRLLQVSGWRNVTLRNLDFRHSNASFQEAAVHVDRSSDVLVEDASFDWNNWGGLKLLQSSRVTVLRSQSNRNGVMGFSGWRTTDLLFDGNANDANNWRGDWSNYHGWDAGSKFYATRRATFRNHRAVGNLTHGLWFDTDNVDVTVERATISGNLRRGLFLEASQGPITVTDSTVCRNGEGGVVDGKSNGVTLARNAIFGNGGMQVYFTGEAGGRAFTTFDTGVRLNILSTDWTVTDNVVATEAAGQQLYRTSLPTADWELVRSTLTADRNTYHSPGEARPFQLPGARKVDLAGWRSATGDDAGSTMAAPAVPLECDATPGADAARTRPAPPATATPGTTPPVTPGTTPTAASSPAPSAPPVAEGSQRLAGATRVLTAIQVAREGDASASTVVLAPAGSHAEALIAAPLAAAVGAPILLNGPSGLDAEVAAEVTAQGATSVYVVGTPGQLPQAVMDDLAARGVTATRLTAPDRYALSALVAREVLARTGDGGDGGDGSTPRVLLALGEAADESRAWPDALCASALAARLRAPILLTRGGDLPDAVSAVLAELRPGLVQIVGGSSAIGDDVAAAAGAAAGGSPARRLAGENRYATSVAVAEEGRRAGLDAGAVWIATGRAFPDALAAGPAAAAAGAPLLLVDGTTVGGSPQSDAWLAAQAGRVTATTVVGGTSAVSAAVEAALVGLLDR